MVITSGIANLIRENKLYQIASFIEAGRQIGMKTLEQDLERLLAAGIITTEEVPVEIKRVEEAEAKARKKAEQAKIEAEERAKREAEAGKGVEEAETKARKKVAFGQIGGGWTRRVSRAKLLKLVRDKRTKVGTKRKAEEAVSADLYEEMVKLTILSPVDLGQMRKLEEYLCHVTDLRVVLVSGSVSKGMEIVVSVRKPFPLIDVLGEMPPVKQVIKKGKKIMVKLKPPAIS